MQLESVQRSGIGVFPFDWRAKAVAQRSSPRSPQSQGTLFGFRFAKVTNFNPTGKGIIFKRLYHSIDVASCMSKVNLTSQRTMELSPVRLLASRILFARCTRQPYLIPPTGASCRERPSIDPEVMKSARSARSEEARRLGASEPKKPPKQ